MSDEKSYVELTNKQTMQLYKKLDDEKKKLQSQIDDISSLTYALMSSNFASHAISHKVVSFCERCHKLCGLL